MFVGACAHDRTPETARKSHPSSLAEAPVSPHFTDLRTSVHRIWESDQDIWNGVVATMAQSQRFPRYQRPWRASTMARATNVNGYK